MSSKGKKEEVKKEVAAPVKKAEVKPAADNKAPAEGNIMDDLSKKQAFKKFSYRGEDITKLLGMDINTLASRQRRRLRRKLHPRYGRFIKKLVDAKKKCSSTEKPKVIKTHLRDCIVLPSMVQSIINVHTGKGFSTVEVKPEMIGYYLGEFAMTYKRVTHGKPGVGATHSSKFVPIK